MNYTREATERVIGVVDDDLIDILDNIENAPEDETSEKWVKRIQDIADEYAISSRYAIMRIIYGRKVGDNYTGEDINNSFEINGEKRDYRFSGISLKIAHEMEESEIRNYLDLLMEIASSQPEFDSNKTEIRRLIKRALQMSKAKKRTLLSREEALRLGHMLDFSLDEEAWFLLRIFDYDEGFRFNRSGDIIEAYGYLTHSSVSVVDGLKARFKDVILSNQDFNDNMIIGTMEMGESLRSLTERWKLNKQTSDKEFIKWMCEHASQFDHPSKTSCRVYRGIATFLFEMLNDKENILPVGELSEKIIRISAELASDSDRICDNSIGLESICHDLYAWNKEYTREKNLEPAWRTMHVNHEGNARLITAVGIGVENRMKRLLSGELQVEKGDLLYLLWVGFCISWNKYYISDGNSNEVLSLTNNVNYFIDTANHVLGDAFLPEFYPPHLMEQSMLMAIVTSYYDTTGDPGYAYSEMCEVLGGSR